MVLSNGKVWGKSCHHWWIIWLSALFLVVYGNALAEETINEKIVVLQGAGQIGQGAFRHIQSAENLPLLYTRLVNGTGVSGFSNYEAGHFCIQQKEELGRQFGRLNSNVLGLKLYENANAGTFNMVASPIGVSTWSRRIRGEYTVSGESTQVKGTVYWDGRGGFKHFWGPSSAIKNTPGVFTTQPQTQDTDQTYFWCANIRGESQEIINFWDKDRGGSTSMMAGWVIHGNGSQLPGVYTFNPHLFYGGKEGMRYISVYLQFGSMFGSVKLFDDLTIIVATSSCSLNVVGSDIVDFGEISTNTSKGQVAQGSTTVKVDCNGAVSGAGLGAEQPNEIQVRLAASATGTSEADKDNTHKLTIADQPGLFIIGNKPKGTATCEKPENGLDFAPGNEGYQIGKMIQNTVANFKSSETIDWTLCRGDGELKTGKFTAQATLSVVTK